MREGDGRDDTRAFICCECGRAIVVFCGAAWCREALCSLCLMLPGWFRDTAMRAALDPTHDGREQADHHGGAPWAGPRS